MESDTSHRAAIEKVVMPRISIPVRCRRSVSLRLERICVVFGTHTSLQNDPNSFIVFVPISLVGKSRGVEEKEEKERGRKLDKTPLHNHRF